ncbi:MAG: hypothetical protein M0Q93_12580, partial [Terrimicrobiaceae bacterium]|nr:hypothetical protein [Terrimicrobiaceae bacterium]
MVEGQAEFADLLVELLEGEKAILEINRRVDGDRRRALRKPAEAFHLVLVIGGDLFAGTGDAQPVKEFEKIAADALEQVAAGALLWSLFRPIGEMRLGDAGGFLDGCDLEGVGKRRVRAGITGHVTTGDEGNLVAEIGELVVHRSGGKQENLGAGTGADDILDEPLIPGAFFGFARTCRGLA